jgi:hypothetical protein
MGAAQGDVGMGPRVENGSVCDRGVCTVEQVLTCVGGIDVDCSEGWSLQVPELCFSDGELFFQLGSWLSLQCYPN